MFNFIPKIFYFVVLLGILLPVQSQTPIEAATYISSLGKGFDVTWSEFKKYSDAFKEEVVSDFAQAGFTNVRIRMNLEKPTLNATFMANLKRQVSYCIKYGISPIIAYQGFLL